jgi:cullin 5
LPLPFCSMESNQTKTNTSSTSSQSQSQAKKTVDSYVRKLMLDSWSESIFNNIKYRLQNSAMKIIYQERIGEPFDSQLVIGVRESYGKLLWLTIFIWLKANDHSYFYYFKLIYLVNLCCDPDDRLKIYKENFEKAYQESEKEFYNKFAQQFIAENGIIKYLTFADTKLKEEERRALKYLETCKGSDSIELVMKFFIKNSIKAFKILI